MTITVKRLCDCPEFVPICQKWDETEWPRTPDIEAFFSDHYAEAAQNTGAELPQAFVAIQNGQAIGMLSLIAEDHPDFLHLKPWIASVYTMPSVRGSKTLLLLIRAAIAFVKSEMKRKFIYSYTHLTPTTKGCEFMQTTYDPFQPSKEVNLYRYDVAQDMDLIKG